MSCDAPLPFAALVDYWARALDADEEARVEEHQFSCDGCARRLAALGELGRAIAAVAARRGGIGMSLTASLAERLERAGLVLRNYRVHPGDVVPCTVGGEDDLLVGWLAADFAGVDRADLVVYDEDTGGQLERIDDVPIDRATSQVITCLAGEVARTWPSGRHLYRLVAVEEGRERTLGDYHFHHTAYRAG